MKILVDIHKQDYIYTAKKHCLPSCDDRTLRKVFYEMVAKGTPLDKIRAEVAAIDVSGPIDERTMFARSGEQIKQMVLEIIDKYNTESGYEK